MGIVEITIAMMAKALMPQELFSLGLDIVNGHRLVDEIMERDSILPTLRNTRQTRLKICMRLEQIQIKSRSNSCSSV